MSDSAVDLLIESLGGDAFFEKTRATNFTYGDSGYIAFTLPSNMTNERINQVIIRLERQGTCTITFRKLREQFAEGQAVRSVIPLAQLREVFSEATGIDLEP